jgi:predicted metalloprotease
MITRVLLILALCAVTPATAQSLQMGQLSPATAKLIAPVVDAAYRMFPRLPSVRLTSSIAATCGGNADTNRQVRYCTTDNAIYVDWELAQDLPGDGRVAYLVAHALGHAIQVRHGVATDALNAIRAEPARETELRGMVTRQVECLAGVLFAGAGIKNGSPGQWFTTEPFTDAHWGRAPMSNGPRVSIGLGVRDDWFRTGQRTGDVAACAVEEMGADKLVRALR